MHGIATLVWCLFGGLALCWRLFCPLHTVWLRGTYCTRAAFWSALLADLGVLDGTKALTGHKSKTTLCPEYNWDPSADKRGTNIPQLTLREKRKLGKKRISWDFYKNSLNGICKPCDTEQSHIKIDGRFPSISFAMSDPPGKGHRGCLDTREGTFASLFLC